MNTKHCGFQFAMSPDSTPLIPRLALWLMLIAGLNAGPFDTGRIGSPALRQDQIASVHVAVTSVSPWEDYVDALQPKFELTPAEALARVSLATQLEDNRAFDGMGFSLRAGIGASLGETNTNPNLLATSNNLVTAGKASAVEGALRSLTNPVPVSSSLHYLAATALYQEVQLINRAFRDALEYEGFTPYVVRLQVTVMPQARNAPFDLITDFAFQVGPPEVEIRDKHSVAQTVRVVPMLATDSIESALHSQAEERLRSLSLALAATLPKVSIGAGFDRVKDAINSISGRDYNATFTAARLTDNTVRCRIGALAQTETRFSLVPQNHAVTVLLFVPDDLAANAVATNRQLRIVANNSLISLKTGLPVRQMSNDDFFRQLNGFFSENHIKFAPEYACKSNQLETRIRLFEAVVKNDFPAFAKLQWDRLRQADRQEIHGVLLPDALWAELTSIWAKSPFAVAQFQLPRKPDGNEDRLVTWRRISGQRLLAVDDGETMTVVCPGFPRLHDSVIMGRLETLGSNDDWLKDLPAGPGTYSEATSALTLQFPSLAAFSNKVSDVRGLTIGLDTKPRQRSTRDGKNSTSQDATVDKSRIETRPVQRQPPLFSIPLTYLPVKKAKVGPKPGFKLFASTKTIVMDGEGRGSVKFAIQDIAAAGAIAVKGSLEGASLAGITNSNKLIAPDSLWWKADKLNATDDTVTAFALEGLNPDTEVVIGAVNSANEGAPEPLKFKVIRPADKK